MDLLPAVQKTAALIQSGDLVGAEQALEQLANEGGTTALISALDQISPKDILALVREHDASKPSIVNLAITPEQFAKTMVLERLYGDRTNDQLRGMINGVIFRDELQTGNFLEALVKEDKGIETLADYLMDRFDPLCFFIAHGVFNPHDCQRQNLDLVEKIKENGMFDETECQVSREEVQDHDWMELTWVLVKEHEDILRDVVDLLASRRRRWIMSGGDDTVLQDAPTKSQPQEDEDSAI